jgi:hypothetical protein
MPSGLTISLEGVEGSGKTTQAGIGVACNPVRLRVCEPAA